MYNPGRDGPRAEQPMPTPSLDHRVAYLEGRIEEQAGMIADVRTDIRGLRADFNALRAETREEFKAVRSETREEFKSLRAEMREFRAEMIRRFEQVDTRFNWVLGLLFAIVLALIGAVLRLR